METELELLDYWRVVVKRKFIIALLVIVSMGSSWVASKMSQPVFEATTTVLVREQKRTDVPFLDSLSNMGRNEVQNYVQILKSRSLMEKVVAKLRVPVSSSDPAEVAGFQRSVSVQPVQGTEAIRISVQSTDREQAKTIANALVEAFIESNQEVNREEARNAKTFIEDQLKVVEADLKEAEEALREFKEKGQIVSPTEETKAAIEKLSELETLKAGSAVALRESEVRLEKLRAQLQKEEPTLITATTITENPVVQSYKGRLSELEVSLASAGEKYTDRHPVVVALQTEIKEIRQKLSREVSKVVSSETRTMNPIYQSLLQQLITLQADAVATQAKLAALDSVIKQEELKFTGLPAKELQLARLLRAQKVTEEIYTLLLTKYQEIRITEVMKTADVQVIDPAIEPESPIKPRTKLNVMIAAFLGLFIGCGLAFFMEYLDTSIKTEQDVQQFLGLPVLGKIPLVESGGGRATKRRRQRKRSVPGGTPLPAGRGPGASGGPAAAGPGGPA